MVLNSSRYRTILLLVGILIAMMILLVTWTDTGALFTSTAHWLLKVFTA